MSEAVTSVRVAIAEDVPELLRHCQMHHSETGVYGVGRDVFPLDDEECLSMIWRGIHRAQALIGVIGEPGGPLEASIYIILTKLWHTSERHMHLEELWTFVHPKKRKSKNAQALTDFAKSAANELGVPLIGGLITNDKTETKLQFYQRTYGDPKGAFFVYYPGPMEKQAGQKKKGIKFWDNPFPRPGVTVIETGTLNKAGLDVVSQLKNGAFTAPPDGAETHG